MILKKIHIESFGNLQNYDLELTSGLNRILHENGWGKSTLAAFIRVMFFGFENENKKKEIEKERYRYTPWMKGNPYGGYLVFSTNNKSYRIERFFAKGNDTFKLYDLETNLESNDYSEKIGEELFGINSDSFSKTVFVAQQSCKTEVTAEINAKIGNVSDDMADMAHFEAASKALQDEKNSLTAKRKTGLINKINQEIANLRNETKEQQIIENSLDKVNELLDKVNKDISDKKARLDKLNTNRDDLSDYNAKLADKKDYDALLEEKIKAENAYLEIKESFGDKIPDIKLIDEIIDDTNRLSDLNDRIENERLSEEEEAEFNRLKKAFSEGVPNEEDMMKLKQKIDEIGIAEDEIKGIELSREENQKFEELSRRLSVDTVSISEIDECLSAWKSHENLKNSIPVYKANEAAMTMRLRSDAEARKAEKEKTLVDAQEKNKKNSRFIIMGGITIIAIAVILFVLLHAWIILVTGILVGTVVLIIGAAKLSKKSMEEEVPIENWEDTPELIQIRKELVETENNIAEIEKSIKQFLLDNGMTFHEGMVEASLYGLRHDLEDYASLSKRMASQKDSVKDTNEKISRLTDEVFACWQRYNISDIDTVSLDGYYKMQTMISKYNELDETTKKIEGLKEKAAIIKSKRIEFINDYELEEELDTEQLIVIREKVGKFEDRLKEFQSRSDALQNYENTHDVSKYAELKEPEEKTTAEELTIAISKLDSELEENKKNQKIFQDRIDEYEVQLEEISSKNEILRQKEEEKKEAERRFDIVSRTEVFLVKAKENFLKHYLAPMQEGFDKYYTMLSGDNTDIYDLDVNFNVKKREQGELHDTDFLSEGYKDMVGLCRRMAMIDAMYDKESPFLIFDDPFVNLDDQKIAHAIRFLNELSKEYQIIYTTCSSSRS